MSRYAVKEADFRLFVMMWNQAVGHRMPALHYRMTDWLEWNWQRGNKNLLLMAFRASGKSTMAALFAAWLLYRNADLRILVLAADTPLAGKMARQIKKIIEKHPLTEGMKPKDVDQWASSRFTVNRMTPLRDPSVLARGITSNITGSRADIIICDDVEVPNTCDTAEKRKDLREKLAEIEYVLTPGGTQLYIGTPHNYDSIYAERDKPFLSGFTRLEIPLLNADGDSAWPEKFTPYEIEKVRLRSGPNKFASQMLLQPVNIMDGRLDARLLRRYAHELDYAKELQGLYLGETRLASASAWWDPAFGSANGDGSVVAVIFSDELGNLYLHRVIYLKVSENDDEAGAMQQCAQVVKAARENFLPSLHVETNGIGGFLPSLLKNEMAKAKVPCAVKDIASTRPKDIRILEAFDAVLAARRLFVHESVFETPFITEMREWQPGKRSQDDGLDAVAGAISREPIRLPRTFGKGNQGWTKGAKTQKAKTEFDV